MRIKGTQTKQEEVSVDIHPVAMWEAIKFELLKQHDIRPYWYLRGDVFMEDEDYGHGSISEKKVADATSEQIRIYNALKKFEAETDAHRFETWDKQ